MRPIEAASVSLANALKAGDPATAIIRQTEVMHAMLLGVIAELRELRDAIQDNAKGA